MKIRIKKTGEVFLPHPEATIMVNVCDSDGCFLKYPLDEVVIETSNEDDDLTDEEKSIIQYYKDFPEDIPDGLSVLSIKDYVKKRVRGK